MFAVSNANIKDESWEEGEEGLIAAEKLELEHIEAGPMRLAMIEAKQQEKEIITRLEKRRLQIIEKERLEKYF